MDGARYDHPKNLRVAFDGVNDWDVVPYAYVDSEWSQFAGHWYDYLTSR